MSNASDFVIENGVLKKYQGPEGDVIIPDGVTSIGKNAFAICPRMIPSVAYFMEPNITLNIIKLRYGEGTVRVLGAVNRSPSKQGRELRDGNTV